MKVLFVGNSHTFTHDVPSIINKLFIENNEKWEYKEMTVSGQTLKFHSQREELFNEIAVEIFACNCFGKFIYCASWGSKVGCASY